MSLNPRKSIIKPQPLIAVRDVTTSAAWYAELLGADPLPDHPHRAIYNRISSSGELLLQLHAWDHERHPNLINPDASRPGHGVLLWFELQDFDAAVQRARKLHAEIVEEPHVNPAPQHREIWLRDPNGYIVVLCSQDGECSPDDAPNPDRIP